MFFCHSKPQSRSYQGKTTYTETKQMGNSTNLAEKIEHDTPPKKNKKPVS